MSVPVSQMWTVASYVIRQKLAGRKQYPLVLMLAPLFSGQLDAQRDHHDFAVCRDGGYDIAVDAVREALQRGFRVTTNTTLFDGADPKSVRAFFDEMMELGVEGMMLSPGYSYEKAPDQQHFLGRARTRRLFRAILSNRKPNWR